MELTPDEIIAAFFAEIERVYGRDYASRTTLFYRHSWFYFSLPIVHPSGLVEFNPYPRPLRKGQVLEKLEELRAIPDH